MVDIVIRARELGNEKSRCRIAMAAYVKYGHNEQMIFMNRGYTRFLMAGDLVTSANYVMREERIMGRPFESWRWITLQKGCTLAVAASWRCLCD